MDISCPACGESETMTGRRTGDVIRLTCGACGHGWTRDPSPQCWRCGRRDLVAVPLAILERGRGTQLSVVGTRTVHLCPECDADSLAAWNRNRPNPLMPDELPTIGKLES
jgi:Zn ribbon nucleic-acid-binding protein